MIAYHELKPQRDITAHKGSCGKIGIIAGSDLYPGAAILAARAALRAGAGVVHVFSTPTVISHVISCQPELIGHPITSGQHMCDQFESLSLDAIAIGPGLGQDPTIQQLVQFVIAHDNRPTVIDADALNALTSSKFSNRCPNQCILTPHLGEFRRLFGTSPEKPDDRKNHTQVAAQTTRQIVLLKGHQTIISDGNMIHVNPTGNPGMASAGTGDVLTGIIVSLIGQGCPNLNATLLGAYIHGKAGDIAYNQFFNGLVASDIINEIASVLESL